MTTWLLEGFGTEYSPTGDVRYREYTTSKRRAEKFRQIPRIQFTDSGHGIEFVATELAPRTKRLPLRHALTDYVNEHMKGAA